MNYKLTNESGEVLDTSENRGPLAYLHGKNNIIPGLEKEMLGKKVGDKFQVVVKPEEGYGVRDEAMVQVVDKAQFGADADNLQLGMQFQLQTPDGQAIVVTVIDIKDNTQLLPVQDINVLWKHFVQNSGRYHGYADTECDEKEKQYQSESN